MVQSVELLLDPRLDVSIRSEWARLEAAGIRRPQLAEYHRPHVTLSVFGAPSKAIEAALPAAATPFPVPVGLGALACFGRGPFVLVRLVVPSRKLLALQAGVAAVVADEALDRMQPGTWTPHVTLARRVAAAEVATALTLLGGRDERFGDGTRVRRWDGDAKREWVIAGGG